MVKPLVFKGDKKPKKRKRNDVTENTTTATDPSLDSTEDDSWSSPENPSELAGPTIFVLPTSPLTCLASDAHGNVFASPLENIIDSNPQTAEPHDVRQVWVASRIAGMSDGEYSFKGSHGGYLSCDEYGTLGARREARGREEGFVVENIADTDGRTYWYLRTAATRNPAKPEERRYVCAKTDTTSDAKQKNKEPSEDDDSVENKKISVSLRGDGEISALDTRIVLRMQTRFRPQSQANKEARVKEKISRKELELAAGRSLTEDEIKRLKRARKEGSYHEEILDIRAKGSHDKFA